MEGRTLRRGTKQGGEQRDGWERRGWVEMEGLGKRK